MTSSKINLINNADYVPQTLDFEHPAKFANELMFARHSMSENETKLWLLTMATLSKTSIANTSSLFTYNMRDIASTLGLMDNNKGWKSAVRKLFDNISIKQLKIMKRFSEDEDLQNWVKIPLYNMVEYNGAKETVSVCINDCLMPYLQNFTSKFTEVEINEMIRISGLTSLKIYLLIKELMAEGFSSISIEQFKIRLGIENSYQEFKSLQRDFIKRAEIQIRKNTSMKHFHFWHDGKGRRPATTIFFSILPNPKELVHTKEVIGEPITLIDKLGLLMPEQRKYYELLYQAGVRPEKQAYELVAKYDIDVIRSNYVYFSEKRAKRKHDEKEIQVGYLVNAIKNDYAKKNREKLAKKAKAAEREQSITDQYAMEDVIINADREFRNQATTYIKGAPLEELFNFIDYHLADISATAEFLGFNFSTERAKDILENKNRRMTFREMNALREVIAQQIKYKRIDPSDYIPQKEVSNFEQTLRNMRYK